MVPDNTFIVLLIGFTVPEEKLRLVQVMKKILVLLMFTFMLNSVFAADTVKKNSKPGKNSKEKTAEASRDSNVEKDDLTVIVTYSMSSLQLGLSYFGTQADGTTRETTEIKYLPNVNNSLGGDISYGSYGFSYSREIPGSGKDSNVYGRSKYNDFQFYYYGDKFGADVYYQKYKGFYLDNASTFGYDENDKVFKRSDMSMGSAGFNVYYSFDDKFSLNKAFKITRNPVKNGGSFLLMVSPNYFVVNSFRSLVLPDQEALYGKYAGFYKGEYYSIALSPGYVYSYTADNGFCFSVLVFGGLGWMKKDYSTESLNIRGTGASIKANVKFLVGYNGESFFCGLKGLGDGTSTKDPFVDEGLSVMSYVVGVEIFCGIRI